MLCSGIKIDDLRPFSPCFLDFKERITIIAGPNGIGKSYLLKAIKQSLQSPMFNEDGKWLVGSFGEGKIVMDVSKELLNKYGVFLIDSIRHLPHEDVSDIQKPSFLNRSTDSRVDNRNFTHWFVNFAYHQRAGSKISEDSLNHFKEIIDILGGLDNTIKYLEINDNFEILLDAPYGKVKFKHLSSGTQSILGIVIPIIFNIERKHPDIRSFRDYGGLILIDEIDAQLHPSWQSKIIGLLGDLFPKAQFVVTTHSPHVIQSVKSDSVISFTKNSEGYSEIFKPTVSSGIYGFQGWSIEEILQDVMGMEDTLSQERRELEDDFNIALENDDIKSAQVPYSILMKILHPKNPLRRIYDHQYRAAGGVVREPDQ